MYKMFVLRRQLVSRLTARLFSTTPLICPSCRSPLPSNLPACTSCWSISPLSPNTSHHFLFGIPYEPNPFSIHLPTLKQRFRQAQAACHPDVWATRNPSQQDLAQTLSSRLNEAYQCLSRPLPRAEYILERNGAQTTESDSLEGVEGVPFIIKIMEARELIDEATPEDRSKIEQLVENTHRDIEDAINELSSDIERQEWTKTKAAAIRLRYLEGIERAAKKWMDNIT